MAALSYIVALSIAGILNTIAILSVFRIINNNVLLLLIVAVLTSKIYVNMRERYSLKTKVFLL